MSLESIRARNAADKAVGVKRTYTVRSRATPGGSGSGARTRPVVALPATLAMCQELADRVPGQPCGSQLYSCRKHDRITTRFTPCSGAALCCATCGDYSPVLPLTVAPVASVREFPAVTTRHLLYHVYPVSGNGAWQQNVAKLVKRIGLFNGRKVVAVCADPPDGRAPESRVPGAPDANRHFAPCDTIDAVRAAFGRSASDIEFIPLTNDSAKRELVSHLPLFSRVETADPTHATLYAQAKGVTRPADHIAHSWADALYRTHLDYWPLVQAALRTRPLAGAFKKLGTAWPAYQSRSPWHYSGSFLWFRNAELFARDWTAIDAFWGGIESYPGRHFAAHEAACLFHETPTPEMNLYDVRYWESTVQPKLGQFAADNADHYAPVPAGSRSLNFGCGPFYREGWLNTDVIASDVINPDILTPLGKPLPFPEGHFERAYLGHVLEHIPWDRVVSTLADVRRVLRPGAPVCVVGPDFSKALDRLRANPGDAGALRHVWEVTEDHSHYQRESMSAEWDGARHHWNCYDSRVKWALERAGFREVKIVEFTPAELGAFPVVDYTNPVQCAVTGVA